MKAPSDYLKIGWCFFILLQLTNFAHIMINNGEICNKREEYTWLQVAFLSMS